MSTYKIYILTYIDILYIRTYTCILAFLRKSQNDHNIYVDLQYLTKKFKILTNSIPFVTVVYFEHL